MCSVIANLIYLNPVSGLLFKQSLTTDTLPRNWKTANVPPIYKKGIKSDPNNYQLVNLTSQVVKVSESLIRDDIATEVFTQS